MKISIMVVLLAGVLSLTTTFSMAAEVKVGGGGAACKGFFVPVADSYKADTGIAIKVIPSTPGQGLIELNEGHIDIATSAVSFNDMLMGAARSGVSIDPSQFVVTEVGSNKTLVFVHKTNPVKRLSQKHLRDIFTGKVKNWKEVGGPDRKIVVVWGIATPGQNYLFTGKILDGEPVTRSRVEVTDYDSIREFIAKTPGAIGINPQGFVTSTTRNPKTPIITSPVIAVTKGKPSPELAKVIQFARQFSDI